MYSFTKTIHFPTILTMETFGTRLKKLRENCGLSQEQLAEKLNYQRTNLANIEAGRKKASDDLMLKLAEIEEFKEKGIDYITMRVWKGLDEYPELRDSDIYTRINCSFINYVPHTFWKFMDKALLEKGKTRTELAHYLNFDPIKTELMVDCSFFEPNEYADKIAEFLNEDIGIVNGWLLIENYGPEAVSKAVSSLPPEYIDQVIAQLPPEHLARMFQRNLSPEQYKEFKQRVQEP